MDEIHKASTGPEKATAIPLDYGVLRKALQDPSFHDQLGLLPCAGRYPADISAFYSADLQDLMDKHVVLEFWGQVLRGTTSGQPRVQFTYLLVPLRFYEQNKSLGTYDSDHPLSWREDVTSLFFGKANSELRGLAWTSLALMQRKNQHYDEAQATFNRASAVLKQAYPKPDEDQQALLRYVRDQVCQTVRDARKDPVYIKAHPNKGGLLSLKESEVKTVCVP